MDKVVDIDETVETPDISSDQIEELAADGVAGDEDVAETAAAKPEVADKEPEAKETEKPEEKPKDGEEGMSVEDVMAEKPAPETESVREKGVSPEAQERIEKKIGKYVKDRNVAQDALQGANKRADDLQTENDQLKAVQVLGDRPVAPKASDYLTDEEMQQAMTKWKDDDDAWKKTKETTEGQDKEYKDRQGKNIDEYKEKKRQRMIDRFPDYVQLVEEGDVDFGTLNPFILNCEHAPEIAYYLVKNLEKLAEIKSLNPVDRAMRIGELSGMYKSIEKRSTKLPKVITPVEGKEGGPKDMFSTEEIDKISKEILETV